MNAGRSLPKWRKREAQIREAATLKNAGAAAMQAGRFESACEYFRSSIAINPLDYLTAMRLGEALIALGQTAAGEEKLRRIGRKDAQIMERLNAAIAEMDSGEPVEAYRQFRAYLDVFPYNPRAAFGLGEAMIALGQIEAGLEQCLRVALQEGSGWMLNTIATHLVTLKMYDDAVDILQMSAEIASVARSESQDEALTYLGFLCLQTGGPDALRLAEDYFRRSEEIHSGNNYNAYALALFAFWRGDYQQTVRILDNRLHRPGSDGPDQPMFLIAEAYIRLGDIGAAVVASRRGIEIDPGNPRYHRICAKALMLSGDEENASREIARAEILEAAGPRQDVWERVFFEGLDERDAPPE